MSLIIEKSIDTRGFWIIDKYPKKSNVLRRVWAMPSKEKTGTYDVYELESSLGSIPLQDFGVAGAGYFKIERGVSEEKVDSFMKSQLEKALKYSHSAALIG